MTRLNGRYGIGIMLRNAVEHTYNPVHVTEFIT